MNRRRRPLRSPDGLDWRDPSMPVIRRYRMGNGTTKVEVDPDYEHRYREHMIDAAEQTPYYDDPTYNLRKPKP